MSFAVPPQEVDRRVRPRVCPPGSHRCGYCQDTRIQGGFGRFHTAGRRDVPCPHCTTTATTTFHNYDGAGSLIATHTIEYPRDAGTLPPGDYDAILASVSVLRTDS